MAKRAKGDGETLLVASVGHGTQHAFVLSVNHTQWRCQGVIGCDLIVALICWIFILEVEVQGEFISTHR